MGGGKDATTTTKNVRADEDLSAAMNKLNFGPINQESRNVETMLKMHESRVAKLMSGLQTGKEGAALPVGPSTAYDNLWALRFCLSHDDDAKALDAARKTLIWRKDNAKMLESAAAAHASGDKASVPERFAAIERFVAQDYHGQTKTGAPIYCIRAGIANTPAMMDQFTREEVIEFIMYRKEIGFLKCDSLTRSTGMLTKLVTINDLNHVSLIGGIDKRFQKALGDASKQSEAFYPQLLEKAVLINVPSIFSAIWSVVKRLLSDKTRQKISVCPGDTIKGDISKCPFVKLLDMTSVPTFLGGGCRCKGGCICGVPNDQCTVVAKKDGDGLLEATVSARDKLNVFVEVDKGDQVAWYMQVMEHGLEVTAELRERNGGDAGKTTTLVEKIKHKASAGVKSEVLDIPASGTLVFTFDNSYSYLNSKQLKYKVENMNIAK